MADDKPIIIIKKKGGHGGHHGGAWKVAYADFVTAMMAFFMVMWLVNSAETATKQNIASYFRRPGIFDSGSGTPLLVGQSGILDSSQPPVGEDKGKKSPAIHDSAKFQKKSGTDSTDSRRRVTFRGEDGSDRPLPEESENPGVKTDTPGDKLSRVEKKRMLEEIAEVIQHKIAGIPDLNELLGVVDVQVGAEGITLEIMDTSKGSMFAPGSASITPHAQKAFEALSVILNKLETRMDISGHTDGSPSRRTDYTNWELSADRANAARRLLEKNGVSNERITSVAGRADKELRLPENPDDPSNRRITLKLRFDFNKKLDLSEDPDALTKLPMYQKEHEDKLAAEEARRKAEKEKAEAESAEDALRKDKNLIKLPEQTVNPRDRSFSAEKDKIFNDSPVVGPPAFFNDY